MIYVFKNWKLLFKNICGNMCGWKSVWKCVKCCLKTENGCLKTQTKHPLNIPNWYFILYFKGWLWPFLLFLIYNKMLIYIFSAYIQGEASTLRAGDWRQNMCKIYLGAFSWKKHFTPLKSTLFILRHHFNNIQLISFSILQSIRL